MTENEIINEALQRLKGESKVHYIFWGKFFARVLFSSKSIKTMDAETDEHQWGWKTVCGEIFALTWHGTTERENVTCKRCKRALRSE